MIFDPNWLFFSIVVLILGFLFAAEMFRIGAFYIVPIGGMWYLALAIQEFLFFVLVVFMMIIFSWRALRLTGRGY